MPTPHTTGAEPSQIGPLAVVAVAATLALIAASGRAGGSDERGAAGATWRGLISAHDADVSVGERRLVLLRAPSLAQRVAAAGGRAGEASERRWTREAAAAQRTLLSALRLQGIAIEPEFTYTRVVNGFSAPLDPRAIALLDRRPEVEGVYPVRVGYPASVSAAPLRAIEGEYAETARVPGFDGRGVTIALLDTGVDRTHPYLAGRVRRGVDVVDRDGFAAADPHPDDPAQLERHGTEMAGILVGSGGPSGLTGIAPRATVLPIRVAGWQRDAAGEWLVYSRTDQLIAGLERAVDPNRDGDAHDGARVTLVTVAEPYAAFADGPGAKAVEGALALDSLVVAPSGNDGPGGPAYGSLSGPGGAPAAVTVGAADLRPQTAEVRVVLRTGLHVRLDRVLSLIGSAAPARGTTLQVQIPRPAEATTGAPAALRRPPPALDQFFDPEGLSLVAGRAALVDGAGAPRIAAKNAADAGAYAILLHGDQLPAGALGLDEDIAVPVVGVPGEVARSLDQALRRGRSVSVSLGRPRTDRNAGSGRIAGFSSRGLAFDGRVKPDLAGPGVAIPTAEPGVNGDGQPRYATVNGSSAAAATVAGAAALLAQARRGIDARALKGLLVGAARPLREDSLAAQGAGLVDTGAAAASEVAAEPSTLAFDWANRVGWRETRRLVVRNVSVRPLIVSIKVDGPAASPIRFRVAPARFRLAPGTRRMVRLRVMATKGVREGMQFEGSVRVAPTSGLPVRVPWSIVVRSRSSDLLSDVELSQESLRPSDAAPAVLSLQAGRVLSSTEVRALERLDIELWRKGRNLGLLARLRNVLPSRLFFALTGRGPGGQVLGRGRYTLRLVAAPAGSGGTTTRTLQFRVLRALRRD